MDYEQISYERRGATAVITIERPERMNAIGAQTHRELLDAWERFRADDSALVGNLTGAGERAFCAGGDLKSHLDGEPVVPLSSEEIAALPQPAIRTDLEAAERGWGQPLGEGLRIEAECFNRLLRDPELFEGLRQFNERDHPDRDPAATAKTPGLRRAEAS
jgi:enoyl-CoA hydratase/carnithine racemase